MGARPKFLYPFLPPMRHLAAIGAIAAYWNMIESNMELAILGLYEIDPGRGLIFTNNLGFQARLSLLNILAGEGAIKEKALADEMVETLKQIEGAYGNRNSIVHALWVKGPTEGVIRRLALRTRNKKLKTYREDFDANELWARVERIRVLEVDFADLLMRLGIEKLLESAPRHSSARK